GRSAARAMSATQNWESRDDSSQCDKERCFFIAPSNLLRHLILPTVLLSLTVLSCDIQQPPRLKCVQCKSFMIHYTTCHCIALHCIALHCIALHCIACVCAYACTG
ncbi:hypothetical protein GW17_00058207, partial [Ensete ventricosum]